MPDAKLSEQCIDGTDLHTGLTTGNAQGRCRNVIVPIGLNQRKRSKPFDDSSLRLGA